MALELTQHLTEMSTTNISWGVKTAGAYGRQPYYIHVSIVLKSGSLSLLESSGPVQSCNGIALLCFTLRLHTDTSTKTYHGLTCANMLPE